MQLRLGHFVACENLRHGVEGHRQDAHNRGQTVCICLRWGLHGSLILTQSLVQGIKSTNQHDEIPASKRLLVPVSCLQRSAHYMYPTHNKI